MDERSRLPLAYAPLAPRAYRKAWRRCLAGVMVLAGVVVLWRYGPPVWRQARYLHDQRLCMTHAAPSDRVVFDNDATAAAALLTRTDEYRPPARPLFDTPWYPQPPATWQAPAFYFHPAADRLGVANGHGVAFMHERQMPSGARRMVAVIVGCGPFGPDGYTVLVGARAFTPATWRLGSRATAPRTASAADAVLIPLNGAHRLRLLAGQPDPADASHFVIPYELDGEPGTIDGWLRPEGKADNAGPMGIEFVELRVRDGPIAVLLLGRP